MPLPSAKPRASLEMVAQLPLAGAAAALLIALSLAAPEDTRTRQLRKIAASPMTWRLERTTGVEPGGKRCALSSRGGDVNAFLRRDPRSKAAAWSIRIGRDSQPNSVLYLRIDKRYFQSRSGRLEGVQAAEIVNLLKGSSVVAFEWARRSDRAKRQGLFGIGDFAAKAAACERWVDLDRAAALTDRQAARDPRRVPGPQYAHRHLGGPTFLGS